MTQHYFFSWRSVIIARIIQKITDNKLYGYEYMLFGKIVKVGDINPENLDSDSLLNYYEFITVLAPLAKYPGVNITFEEGK